MTPPLQDVPRGYHGIGIVGAKTPLNVGTLWRSAGVMGAGFIFTAGRRYPKQASDTIKAWRHIPYLEFEDGEDLHRHIPYGCVPVGVEQCERSRPLAGYCHPERAIYILGAEDRGVPADVLAWCRDVIAIPSSRCLNVAVAGSIVLYDRAAKESRP